MAFRSADTVAVVGAGGAAVAAASVLLEAGLRVDSFAGSEPPQQSAAPWPSHWAGGLAQLCADSCYPLRPEDYARWPVAAADMVEGYRTAQRLLGLRVDDDALLELYPDYGPAQVSPPALSFQPLLASWRPWQTLMRAAGLRAGHARIVVPSGDLGGASPSAAWGAQWIRVQACAEGRLRRFRGCTLHSFCERAGQAELRLRRDDGGLETRRYRALFLGGGALDSVAIAARSLSAAHLRSTLRVNDVYVLPFVIERERRQPRDTTAPGLARLVLAFDPGVLASGHAQLQLFGAGAPALPLLTSLPSALRGRLQRSLAIGILQLHSDDSRRLEMVVPGEGAPALAGRCDQGRDLCAQLADFFDSHQLQLGLRPLRALIRRLAPGGAWPLGATLPFATTDDGAGSEIRGSDRLGCDASGLLRGCRHSYVIDSAAFPFVPPQGCHFTAMANAVRTARGFVA